VHMAGISADSMIRVPLLCAPGNEMDALSRF